MLHFTIDATSQTGIIVSDGTVKLSRLKWIGTGIRIYLLGAMTDKNRDALNHIAMDLCAAHHIPLVSLRLMKSAREVLSKPNPFNGAFLRGLFEVLNEEYDTYRYDCHMCGKPCQSIDANGHCSWCRQVWNS
jgi:hypothetical protein